MKLVLTLLVRDEEDIIYENILYHLNHGVDFIILTDNRSVDGTQEIIRGFEKQGVLSLIHENGDTYSQAQWVTKMARMAKTVHNADWVINCDADEFWWPKSGDLKQALSEVSPSDTVVRAKRHNFCALKEGVGSWYENMVYRTRVSVDSMGRLLSPKICHRGIANVDIAQGNHLTERPKGLRIAPQDPIEILHFPLRSAAQFTNKIVKGGAAYERNAELCESIGDCWRQLYKKWQGGKLDEYLSEQILSDAEIQKGIREEALVADTRLRDFLREHLP